MGRAKAFLLAICLVLAGALGGLISPMQVQAQDEALSSAVAPEIDYDAWKQITRRAEEAVQDQSASNTALEDLRQELALWRGRFQEAQSVNRSLIQTVKAQIEALGPAPAEGAPEEAADIAAERKELTSRLAVLEAPVKSAEVAYSQADSLIRGVDNIIRQRQTNALLNLGPSPLNPANWPGALSALMTTAAGIAGEIRENMANPEQRAQFRTDLPLSGLLLVLGLVLLLRGRRWMERLALRVQRDNPGAGRWLIGFCLSLGQIALPVTGLLLTVGGLNVTGIPGPRGADFLWQLPVFGLGMFTAIWLGAQIFPKRDVAEPLLDLSPQHRRAGRLYAGLIGLAIAFYLVGYGLSDAEEWSDEQSVTLLFPPLFICGLLLLRMARLMMLHNPGHDPAEEREDEPRKYRNSMIALVARVLGVLAVLGPALAVIGYFEAAQFIVISTALSLQLLAFLMILQRLIAELYVLLTGNREGMRESLILVLAGFLLALASLPVFALIWGARLADLSELWTSFRTGFEIGGVRISPTIFLTFAVVFAVGYLLTRLLQSTLRNTVLPRTRMDVGGRNAITAGTGYVGIFLAALAAVNSAGIDLSSLAIVAGALSVGIGFGLQNIVSNFVSGIILLIERPISEGDWIEVGGHMGYVRDISVRSTRIETFDRTDVIVPNADFVSGTVTNYTRGNTVGRLIVSIRVAFSSDVDRVVAILNEIAEAQPMVVINPPPNVYFVGIGEEALNFEIRAMLRDINWVMAVKSDILCAVVRKFAEEGIEMPHAARDLWLRNPEVLHPSASIENDPEGVKP